jgi:hypothetical protein
MNATKSIVIPNSTLVSNLVEQTCVKKIDSSLATRQAKYEIIKDICSEMSTLQAQGKVKKMSAEEITKEANSLTLYTKPQKVVDLCKVKNQLKISSIALAVGAVALAVVTFFALIVTSIICPATAPLNIAAVIFGVTALFTSPTLLLGSFATGMATVAKGCQYKKEVHKTAQLLANAKAFGLANPKEGQKLMNTLFISKK